MGKKMKIVKNSSFEEYIQWYLQREFEKNERPEDDPENYKNLYDLKKYMRLKHSGKVRDWFHVGKWFIIQIDDINDIDNLVCLDGGWVKEYLIPDESRNEKNFRILKKIVSNAKESEYFMKSKDDLRKNEYSKRFEYYNKLKQGGCLLPRLINQDKIVLCSLNSSEKSQNPTGTYYLHDGLGRLLAYKYLIDYEGKHLNTPIEAFLVENPQP